MDHRSHNYHHRQSLKPVAGVTSSASSLASRYGLSGSGGRTLATSSGSNTGLSSSVVSFMRKVSCSGFLRNTCHIVLY